MISLTAFDRVQPREIVGTERLHGSLRSRRRGTVLARAIPKVLYAKAQRGEIAQFTGISAKPPTSRRPPPT
ncbi:adenylyl-sulfate kinase [Cupriavidus basilensis]